MWREDWVWKRQSVATFDAFVVVKGVMIINMILSILLTQRPLIESSTNVSCDVLNSFLLTLSSSSGRINYCVSNIKDELFIVCVIQIGSVYGLLCGLRHLRRTKVEN